MDWKTYKLTVDARCVESGVWMAHCLQLDIFAEGGSIAAAIRALIAEADLAIRWADENDFDPFVSPAPPAMFEEFHKLREASVDLGVGEIEELVLPAHCRRLLLDLALQLPRFAKARPSWFVPPPPAIHASSVVGAVGC